MARERKQIMQNPSKLINCLRLSEATQKVEIEIICSLIKSVNWVASLQSDKIKIKIKLAPFTAGQDWMLGTFFLRSQAMDEEMLIQIHFPRLSRPALNLFSLSFIFAKSLLFLSTFSCHFFPLLCLFFIQFALWIDRILTKSGWNSGDNEDFSMRISLWRALCSSRNVFS